ncbi:hypothetical protein K8T06_12635 [bacterium]|nr:hypothetical protein [bacterium]
MSNAENTDKTIEEILKEEDLDLLILELTKYTEWKIRKRRFSWRTRSTDMIAEGYGAGDFVSDAFESVLDKNSTRNWNRGRYPTPKEYLKSIIDSLVSNLSDKLDNKRVENYDQLINGDLITGKSLIHLKMPDEILNDNEVEAKADHVLNELMKGAEGDDEFEEFISYYFEGILKIKEIAEKMGIPEKRGYLLSRKLGRRIKKLTESMVEPKEERIRS